MPSRPYCASVPPFSAFGMGAATGSCGGALSDRLRVPFADGMLVPVHDDVDPKTITALGDTLCDAYRTVAPQLEAHPQADVFVLGGGGFGSIGLYAAGMAVALGAARVTYVDPDEGRRARAARLGAEVLAEPQRAEPGHAVTVDASGDPELLRVAICATAPEGVCTSVGIYFEPTPLPLLGMYVKGIEFRTGRGHARALMPKVLELIKGSNFAPEIATTRVLDRGDAVDALDPDEGRRARAARLGAASRSEGARVIRTPIQAPNANAYAERWVRTVRDECLDWLLIFGRRQLERVFRTYVDHYNRQRPHRALDLHAPDSIGSLVPLPRARPRTVRRRDRLGGLLHEYELAA
jgi:NADPH:quinone reductase-like Zn-dependent oxidoreductase